MSPQREERRMEKVGQLRTGKSSGPSRTVCRTHLLAWLASATLAGWLALGTSQAVLVQPLNYMLDDSGLLGPQVDQAGSLSPFQQDQQGGGEQSADRDIVGIIGDSLARLRYARMLNNQQAASVSNGQEQQNDNSNSNNQDEQAGQLSQEMAELLQRDQQEQAAGGDAATNGAQSLSSSVASMLMNVAQAAQAAANGDSTDSSDSQSNGRPQIMELDTSPSASGASGSHASSAPSKADLKQPVQWYNPKETIPVLKISSMGECYPCFSFVLPHFSLLLPPFAPLSPVFPAFPPNRRILCPEVGPHQGPCLFSRTDAPSP